MKVRNELSIGEKLLKLRREKGYTQIDVQNKTGIHQTKLTRLEQNIGKMVREEDLKILADLYGVDVSYFYGSKVPKGFSALPKEIQEFIVKEDAFQYIMEAYMKYISDKRNSSK